MKTDLFIEYKGIKADTKVLTEKIKDQWKAEGNKIKDINYISLYIKPEDKRCYYVINNDYSGSVSIV